jgi:hypothetical protein
MSRRTRFLLIAMSVSFGVSAVGLVAGLLHYLYRTFENSQSSEAVLGGSILYNEITGAFGILGFLFFLAFLISAISERRQDHRR